MSKRTHVQKHANAILSTSRIHLSASSALIGDALNIKNTLGDFGQTVLFFSKSWCAIWFWKLPASIAIESEGGQRVKLPISMRERMDHKRELDLVTTFSWHLALHPFSCAGMWSLLFSAAATLEPFACMLEMQTHFLLDRFNWTLPTNLIPRLKGWLLWKEC